MATDGTRPELLQRRLPRSVEHRIERHLRELGHPDPAISYRAELRLIRFGPRAAEAVLRAARESNPEVRFRAAWILGKSHCPEALSTLLELAEDPDARVSYDALLALGELGDGRAAPLLRRIANRPGDERALDSAARQALSRLDVAGAAAEGP